MIDDLANGQVRDGDQGVDMPQIAFAVGTQVGPDGKNLMVSLHLGTGVMSVVAVIPAKEGDRFADQLCAQIKKAAKECRSKNSGLIL